jgi:hypothetical protein
MVEFRITGWDIKIPVAVCSYISLLAIIGINLMQQEQFIFDITTDQVVFSSAMGAHRGWKLAQVDTAHKPDTFHINTLVNEVEVARIFSMEAAMLQSGPPSHNGARQPPTQTKWAMIRDAVICSVTPEWRTQFEALLTRYADMISESKTNLGQSDTVIHNIKLTDHMPVYTKQFPLPSEH